MEIRTLNRTGLTVSRACLGTMTFGAQTDEPTAVEMVSTCLDRGVNFFDTANIYNQGAAEAILGRALAGRRDRVVLAGKSGGSMKDSPDQNGLSRQAILRAVEASLQRLKTDYLDLYYLHWPDYTVPMEESLEAVTQLIQQGKVRHLGASNYASWQLTQLLWIAEKEGLVPVRATQPFYNLLARGIEQELLPMCREFGLSTIVYNPLAGGMLTGKQTSAAAAPGTRFDKNQAYLDRYWNDANFAALEELAAVASESGRSRVSLALNWILHHTPVDCIILGASKLSHLRDNLDALADGALPPPAAERCDEIWGRLRGPSPRYNR